MTAFWAPEITVYPLHISWLPLPGKAQPSVHWCVWTCWSHSTLLCWTASSCDQLGTRVEVLSQAWGCRSRWDCQLPAAPGKRPVPDLIASPGERLTPESPESKVLLDKGSGCLCHHSLRLLIFIDEEQGPGKVRLQPGYK